MWWVAPLVRGWCGIPTYLGGAVGVEGAPVELFLVKCAIV